jgi:hypothetical protein
MSIECLQPVSECTHLHRRCAVSVGVQTVNGARTAFSGVQTVNGARTACSGLPSR